jgi:adenine-specific DNA-methyltransferase
MGTKTADIINRQNGIYYTPNDIAIALAKEVINADNLSVLDPSYGEGALLLAAEKLFRSLSNENGHIIELHGCDTQPINGLIKHLPKTNLHAIDFFDFNNDKKHDVILMNPPFVRRHKMKKEMLLKYQQSTNSIISIKKSADLWVYFLIKAVIEHLKVNGSLGVILPWSFLQADFSKNVREWTLKNFGSIRVLALKHAFFKNTDERIILLWLKGYGQKNKIIKCALSNNISEIPKYNIISNSVWKSGRIIDQSYRKAEELISEYISEYGYSRLKNWTKVRIGVVTGADSFFILSNTEIENLKIQCPKKIPIINTSKRLNSLELTQEDSDKNLLIYNDVSTVQDKEYIDFGRNRTYHLRAHSKNRNPWYKINSGLIPDGFFPYRKSRYPHIVFNKKGYQCTNSVHRLYFKKISPIEQKWLQLSQLTAIGQISIEYHSKNYGRRMLKIEPSALNESLVYVTKDETINNIYSINR